MFALIVSAALVVLATFWCLRERRAMRPEVSHRVVNGLPIAFEPNLGQAPPDVSFIAHRGRSVLFFCSRGVRAVVPAGDGSALSAELAMEGAAEVPGEGQGPLPGVTHYLLGDDASQWRVGVPTFARVVFEDIYPGIDLIWHGERGELEYDFVVEPGADLSRIRLSSAGQLPPRWTEPVAYQEHSTGGRSPVVAQWLALDDGSLSFAVGAYDSRRRLVIDPVLSFSSWWGGSASDRGLAVAVDNMGAIYVAGETFSTNFPVANASQGAFRGSRDAVVMKLNPSATAVIYSTYLGGSGDDTANGIATDGSGAAYVTGNTASNNFPTVNAQQSAIRGSDDVFVTKLNADGSVLVYSTFLGGTGSIGDFGKAIAVDASGSAYVVGSTSSNNFPVVGALQPTRIGGADAFLVKYSPTGGSLVYSTFLGGSLEDSANGVAVDSSGSLTVVGTTNSTDFPRVAPTVQMNPGGGTTSSWRG